MTRDETHNASGIQLAFLIFAIVFLAYPVQKHLGPLLGINDAGKVVSRLFIFVPAIALLLLVPAFRRSSIRLLRTPVTYGRALETGLVAGANVALPFAIAGGIVAWYWMIGGEMALARRIGQQRSIEVEVATALTAEGMLFSLLLAGIVAPLVEELLFRGLLYRAWEAQWGWFWSMLGTSAVFAAYHPVPLAAFTGSIIFIAVMRRAGSIWAAIVVHSAGNIALWPLLMGRFYFQTAGKETGEISLWPLHLAALAVLVVALPVYVWMARNPPEEEHAPAEAISRA